MSDPLKDPFVEAAKLANEEWDFSMVPEGELRTCLRYEYAREVLAPRSYFITNFDDMGEDHSSRSLQAILRGENFLFESVAFDKKGGGVTTIWEEFFPHTPWQSIPSNEKLEMVYNYETENRSVRGTSEEYWDKDLQPRTKFYKINSLGIQALPIFVDWTFSDASLVDDFSRWLKEFRPPRVSIKTDRSHQWLRDHLNALSALRLRHFYTPAGATAISLKAQGEPLYLHPFSWNRAAGRAISLFKSMFPSAGQPKSAKLKPSLRGRPPRSMKDLYIDMMNSEVKPPI